MKIKLLFLISICTATKVDHPTFKSQGDMLSTKLKFCDTFSDVTYNYRFAGYEFDAKFYKAIAKRSGYHFVFSPYSIWIILAAVAEGSDSNIQQRLFQFLSLPNDPCVRQRYYKIATRRLISGEDVKLSNIRAIVLDQGVSLNLDWYDFVVRNSMMEVLSSPIKRYPQIAANDIRRIVRGSLPSLDLSGNSVLLDAFDYSGLWTMAFNDAVIERAPFYDSHSKRIGAVDLMRVKRRVRMAYIPVIKTKIVELSVGANSRYRLMVGLVLDGGDLGPAIEYFSASLVVEMLDLKSPSSALSFISSPAALPSSFVQRSTLTLGNTGLFPPPNVQDVYNASTGLDPVLGKDFIADRPFVFGLFDAETYTNLLASAYTKPLYT